MSHVLSLYSTHSAKLLFLWKLNPWQSLINPVGLKFNNRVCCSEGISWFLKDFKTHLDERMLHPLHNRFFDFFCFYFLYAKNKHILCINVCNIREHQYNRTIYLIINYFTASSNYFCFHCWNLAAENIVHLNISTNRPPSWISMEITLKWRVTYVYVTFHLESEGNSLNMSHSYVWVKLG